MIQEDSYKSLSDIVEIFLPSVLGFKIETKRTVHKRREDIKLLNEGPGDDLDFH